MKLEVGKTYEVNHTRKGRFTLKVKHDGDEFVTGLIISGTATAMMRYNVVEEGEQITVRKELAFFKLID